MSGIKSGIKINGMKIPGDPWVLCGGDCQVKVQKGHSRIKISGLKISRINSALKISGIKIAGNP